MAKLIVHGADRPAALRRLKAALAASTIQGIPNTLDLQRAIAEDGEFAAGGMDTGFLQRFLTAPRPAGARAVAPGIQP
jgi:acetyl/propionyl-CoA carboxylase alpha subunit